MKQVMLAAALGAAIGVFAAGGASAQTTGPAPQDSTKMNNPMSPGSSAGTAKTGTRQGATTGMAAKTSKKHPTKKNDVQPSRMSKGSAK